MTLDRYTDSRRNNFDILRLVFAFLVLFGHSFPISGNGVDPISALILPHDWIGGIAVHGFFAISGFLVTASLMQRGLFEFIASRALRIYPGVIFFCVVAVIVVGPLGTKATLSQYFSARPWYFFLNASLWDWIYNLPYAFSGNPFPGATNGSAWTLPIEIRCYALVLAFGFFGIFDSRSRANIALLFLLYLVFTAPTSIPIFTSNGELRNISCLMYFLVGCLFWINRSHIPLNGIAIIAIGAISVLAWKLGRLHYVLPGSLVYALLFFVYRAPHFSVGRLGDISFGVYLYAWPIQQLVWVPGQSAYINALLSTVVTIPVAYISWRFIEKPALSLRKYLRTSEKPMQEGQRAAHSNLVKKIA